MKIILYTNDCPQCRILKSKLDEKHVQYEVCMDSSLMIDKGFRSVPMLEVDDKIMGFNEAIRWTKEI